MTDHAAPAIRHEPSAIWSDVYRALRDEGVSDEHATARADLVRIEHERRMAARLPAEGARSERLAVALERLLRQRARGGEGLGFNADMHEEAVVRAILADPEVQASIAGNALDAETIRALREALLRELPSIDRSIAGRWVALAFDRACLRVGARAADRGVQP